MWSVRAIPIYRVYQLYDNSTASISVSQNYPIAFGNIFVLLCVVRHLIAECACMLPCKHTGCGFAQLTISDPAAADLSVQSGKYTKPKPKPKPKLQTTVAKLHCIINAAIYLTGQRERSLHHPRL